MHAVNLFMAETVYVPGLLGLQPIFLVCVFFNGYKLIPKLFQLINKFQHTFNIDNCSGILNTQLSKWCHLQISQPC